MDDLGARLVAGLLSRKCVRCGDLVAYAGANYCASRPSECFARADAPRQAAEDAEAARIGVEPHGYGSEDEYPPHWTMIDE